LIIADGCGNTGRTRACNAAFFLELRLSAFGISLASFHYPSFIATPSGNPELVRFMPPPRTTITRGRSRFASGAVSLSIVAAITTLSCAFKAEEFRYCQETSFCRRHRKFDGQNSQATYFLHGAQQLEDGSVSGYIPSILLLD
jgi:hypothetical protein